MKRNHNEPQEIKKRTRKILKEKCLWLSDRHTSIRVTVDLLTEHCYMSRSNAYKIVSGSSKLQKPLRELLFYKLAGSTPLGAGYYMTPEGLSMPNGFVFNSDQLDQYAFYMQMHNAIDRDMRSLLDTIETLKYEKRVLQRRIDWLNQKERHESKKDEIKTPEAIPISKA